MRVTCCAGVTKVMCTVYVCVCVCVWKGVTERFYFLEPVQARSVTTEMMKRATAVRSTAMWRGAALAIHGYSFIFVRMALYSPAPHCNVERFCYRAHDLCLRTLTMPVSLRTLPTGLHMTHAFALHMFFACKCNARPLACRGWSCTISLRGSSVCRYVCMYFCMHIVAVI
jgi:hypothetical protein